MFENNPEPTFNEVIRCARDFIRAINNHYGENVGATTWNAFINTVEECVQNDVIFGLISNRTEIYLTFIPDNISPIQPIILYRQLTGKGLRESKDNIERVKFDKIPLVINVSNIIEEEIDKFILEMRKLGCLIS